MQLERKIVSLLITTRQEDPNADTPIELHQPAVVREWAGWEKCRQMKFGRLSLVLGRHPSLFKKVDPDVGITFTIGFPKHRSFNRLNRLPCLAFNSVGTIKRLARLIDRLEIRNDRPNRRAAQAVCLCCAAVG